MNRIRKIEKNEFKHIRKDCQFCHTEINLKTTDVFEISVPGIIQNICRHCLVKLYKQIQDVMIEETKCAPFLFFPSKKRKPKPHQYRLIASVLNGESK